jgi:hypothetical protein
MARLIRSKRTAWFTHTAERLIAGIVLHPAKQRSANRYVSVHLDAEGGPSWCAKLPVAIGTYERHRAWREAGHGLREIIYLPWADAEFLTEDNAEKAPEGFVLAVVWWQRGWQGEVRHTYWISATRNIAEA